MISLVSYQTKCGHHSATSSVTNWKTIEVGSTINAQTLMLPLNEQKTLEETIGSRVETWFFSWPRKTSRPSESTRMKSVASLSFHQAMATSSDCKLNWTFLGLCRRAWAVHSAFFTSGSQYLSLILTGRVSELTTELTVYVSYDACMFT